MSKEHTVLVTGVTGFVGGNLKVFLEENQYRVQGVSRKSSKDRITYDSLNASQWNSAYGMIHLAGKAHDLKGTAQDKEYFEVNTELTKQLFDQFMNSSCSVFIYISSVKAVADVVSGELTEDFIPNPVTAYGKSKLAAETYLLAQKLPEDKKLYILRPCMIHGPGNKGNLNLLFKIIQKRIPYPLGAFENRRSFLTIANFNFIIQQLLKKNIPSGIYNIADDEAISTNSLIRTMCETLKYTPKIWSIPKGFLILVAKLGDKLHLPLNSFKLDKLTENYVVSNQKIKSALGINQLPLSTKEGLKITVKSFKNTK